MADTPNTVPELLDYVRKYGWEYFGIFNGKYDATVMDNKDPLKMGRVKLSIPQVAGKNKVEIWATPAGNSAGKGVGDFRVPPKGGRVKVCFKNGDPSHPEWEGGSWAKGEAPGNGDPKKRTFETENWRIEQDDNSGGKLTISDKSGNGKIQIDSDKNVSVNTDAKCNISALQGGNFDMGSGGSISFTPGQIAITMGGSSIIITAGGVSIMGRDFLSHVHSGVQTGAGNTTGVV